jgi:pimeloyl-ACP methyl ester carboxylesterase
MLATMDAAANVAPPADREAEPEGYIVVLDERDRIHFLDWEGPTDPRWADQGPGVLLLHGLASTARSWTPVARRLRAARHVVAMDLRGHGLSDAPTEGYEAMTLAEDVVAVAEGSGLVPMELDGPPSDGHAPDRPAPGVVLAGHGFGAIVAAWAAAELGPRCAGLVLVDGGWEDLADASGLDPDEFLRGLDEPPEVLRSMDAYLADREGFDPSTWDEDQAAAARAAVVELPVGRVEPAIHEHVRTACVGAMFEYEPVASLRAVTAPVTVLVAADDEEGNHARTLDATLHALAAAGRSGPRVIRFPADGHNLMRYRPAEVTHAILAAASEV